MITNLQDSVLITSIIKTYLLLTDFIDSVDYCMTYLFFT